MTMTESARKDGRVVGIAGPVIDVEFQPGSLPELNNALEFTVNVDGKAVTVLAEVAQQLGHSRVRAVSRIAATASFLIRRSAVSA